MYHNYSQQSNIVKSLYYFLVLRANCWEILSLKGGSIYTTIIYSFL